MPLEFIGVFAARPPLRIGNPRTAARRGHLGNTPVSFRPSRPQTGRLKSSLRYSSPESRIAPTAPRSVHPAGGAWPGADLSKKRAVSVPFEDTFTSAWAAGGGRRGVFGPGKVDLVVASSGGSWRRGDSSSKNSGWTKKNADGGDRPAIWHRRCYGWVVDGRMCSFVHDGIIAN